MTQPIRRGGRGFKIADGFVEVTGVHDRSRTRRAAQEAGGDAGNSFTRAMADRVGGKNSSNQIAKAMLAGLGTAVKGLLVGSVGLAAIAAIGQGVAAALAGLTAAAAGAIPLINSLAAALATAAGAALALPGAISILAFAIASLKVGLAGVGEALKATGGDAATFEEAIKDLAPEAQKFVRVIREMRPAFKELRLDVQNALFKDLGESIHELAHVHMVSLRSQMVAVTTSINRGLIAAIERLSTAAAKADIRSIFSDAASAVSNVTEAFGPLVQILLDLSTVGAKVVSGLTQGFEGFVIRWQERIAEMRESGELEQMIRDGLDALKQLGRALGDLGGIIKGVFGAAGQAESSGGLFGLLDRLNEFVNRGDTQKKLVAFFDNVGRVGSALMPVLSALLGALGTVSGAIGDIAERTAPHLAAFLTLFGDALARLAPAFIALGPAVVALGKGLMPLAEILSDLVVAAAPGIEAFLLGLGGALHELAPVAGPVGKALGDLMTAIAPLLPVLGGALAQSLSAAASALSAFATAFAPLIEQFASGVMKEMDPQTLVKLAEAGALLGESFAKLADELAPMIPLLVEFTVFVLNTSAISGILMVTAAIDQLTRALDIWKKPFEFAIGLFHTFQNIDWGGTGSAIGNAFTTAWDAVFRFVSGVVTWFTNLPGQVVGFISELPGKVAAVFLDLTDRALYWVGYGIGRILRFFIDLPGQVIGFISGLPARVGAIIHSTMERARVLVSRGISNVVGFFKNLPGRARTAISSLWSRMSGVFSSAGSNAKTAAKNLVSGFIGFLNDLPGKARAEAIKVKSRIVSAFSGAKGWLYSAGRNILVGLANGLRGAIGVAVQAGKDAAGSVLRGIKEGLGIRSPSAKFRDEVGYWIPAGIAEGIKLNRRAVVDAMAVLGRMTEHDMRVATDATIGPVGMKITRQVTSDIEAAHAARAIEYQLRRLVEAQERAARGGMQQITIPIQIGDEVTRVVEVTIGNFAHDVKTTSRQYGSKGRATRI